MLLSKIFRVNLTLKSETSYKLKPLFIKIDSIFTLWSEIPFQRI